MILRAMLFSTGTSRVRHSVIRNEIARRKAELCEQPHSVRNDRPDLLDHLHRGDGLGLLRQAAGAPDVKSTKSWSNMCSKSSRLDRARLRSQSRIRARSPTARQAPWAAATSISPQITDWTTALRGA